MKPPVRGFPDTERELMLRACMQLLIKRKQQQGSARKDLTAQHVRAQALDANGLCLHSANHQVTIYLRALTTLCPTSALVKYDVKESLYSNIHSHLPPHNRAQIFTLQTRKQ